MSSRRASLAVALLLAADARARTVRGALDFTRATVSPRDLATAGSGDGFDPFRATANPASLAAQPADWSVGASDQTMFGGGQNVWALCASRRWRIRGTPGLLTALVATGVRTDALIEQAPDGSFTGRLVAPEAWQLGALMAARKGFVSWGLAVRFARIEFAGMDPGDVPAVGRVIADCGILVAGGGWEAGGALLGAGRAGSLDAAATVRFRPANARFPWSAGASWKGPVAGGLATRIHAFGAGGTWQPVRALSFRAGWIMRVSRMPVSGGPRFGAGVLVRGLAFDYAATLTQGDAGGVNHAAGVSWAFGRPDPTPSR